MNEPKQYEVQSQDASGQWVVVPTDEPVTDPIAFAQGSPGFRFKQLPDGPLFRVEPKSIKPHGSDLDIAVTEAHLVRIHAEPEGQQKHVESVPAPEPQRTDWQNIEAKDAQIGDEHSFSGERWHVITKEDTVRRFHAGELTGYRLRRAVTAQRETEWRELGAGATLERGDEWSDDEGVSWNRCEPSIGHRIPAIHAFRYRRPAPAQREGTDGAPECEPTPETDAAMAAPNPHSNPGLMLQYEIKKAVDCARTLERQRKAWEESAAQFHRNECFYRDLIHQIGKPFGVAAMTSDDGSVQQDILALKVPELVAALQAERDTLAGHLTKIGNACISGITGAAEDGHETDPEILWKAISESVRLGHERNDEANALKGQLAESRETANGLLSELEGLRSENEQMAEQRDEARQAIAAAERDLAEWESLNNIKLAEVRLAADPAFAIVLAQRNKTRQSLTAAKAELATCREEATKVLRALEGTENFKEDCECGPCKAVRILRAFSTPPPSAQA